MTQSLILKIFIGVLAVGLLLRIFVFDLVVISNNELAPDFYSQDILLVNKLSSSEINSWVLIEDYPSPGNYSVRRLTGQNSEDEWLVSPKSDSSQEASSVHSRRILGQVVMVLWSSACKPSSEDCSERSFKFLTFVN